jgi:hypothetical protein
MGQQNKTTRRPHDTDMAKRKENIYSAGTMARRNITYGYSTLRDNNMRKERYLRSRQRLFQEKPRLYHQGLILLFRCSSSSSSSSGGAKRFLFLGAFEAAGGLVTVDIAPARCILRNLERPVRSESSGTNILRFFSGTVDSGALLHRRRKS